MEAPAAGDSEALVPMSAFGQRRLPHNPGRPDITTSFLQDMKKIAPKDIRFIKLGRAGKWEKSSLEKDQVIRLGYVSPHHEQCLAGDWKPVEAHWRNVREGKVGPAKSDIRQIRDFYEQPSTTLWITFYARQLWWCFADEVSTPIQI